MPKKKTSPKLFSEKLREVREAADITQAEAAELVGIAQSAWSAMENGSLDRKAAKIAARMAEYLAVLTPE